MFDRLAGNGRRRSLLFLLLTLGISATGALFPSLAPAASFVVNSTGDQPDENVGFAGCTTSANTCTLRAAIEESNASTPVRDSIVFGASFDGGVEDAIAPSTELPPFLDPVTINGRAGNNPCATVAFRPCVGIDGPGDGSALRVESDEVTIEGLSLTGAETGIEVVASSDDLVARRDWIGAGLDLSPDGNSTGIFLGPGSNQARIGGYINGAGGSNLIVNNEAVGLDLEGASGSRIVDNEFGLIDQSAAPNGENIEITDSVRNSTIKAVDNEIGAEVFPFGGEVTACTGGCNLIAGATTAGIDLQGDDAFERPASGPTTIRSNFIGSDYLGEEAIENGSTAIVVGEADEVTIGGPEEKDGNWISGGQWGITSGPDARYLRIESNRVGRGADGSVLNPPALGAISVNSAEVLFWEGLAEITANQILMQGGLGIDVIYSGALVAENRIYGTDLGIHVHGANNSFGSLVAANELESPGVTGILVENSKNDVVGNFVFGAENAGVKVAGDVRENIIGGDSEEEENEIHSSGGAAIEIVDASFIDVAQNWGEENGGPFIDLGGDGSGNDPSGPNGGVQPPLITSATPTGASGTATPWGAFIRVFAKADASPGEVESFLASAVAKDGKWSVTYPEPIPAGTPIAVSQTAFEGTSELAVSTTTAVESGGATPGPGGGKSGKQPVVVNACDLALDAACTPVPPRPYTRIVGGPGGQLVEGVAMFKFISSARGSTFQCKLDRKPFKKCRSPKTYKQLKPGKYVFRVRAIDKAGDVDPTPAKRKFTVIG
jgi:CSLREA domain-containing protein